MKRVYFLRINFLVISVTAQYYLPDESFCKGGLAVAPEEFKNGTATLEQVKAWTSAIREGCYFPQETIHPLEVFVASTQLILTTIDRASNSNYLVFLKKGNQYKYLDTLSFSSLIKTFYYPSSNNLYLLLSGHISATESALLVIKLQDERLMPIAHTLLISENAYDRNTYNKLTSPFLMEYYLINFFLFGLKKRAIFLSK